MDVLFMCLFFSQKNFRRNGQRIFILHLFAMVELSHEQLKFCWDDIVIIMTVASPRRQLLLLDPFSRSKDPFKPNWLITAFGSLCMLNSTLLLPSHSIYYKIPVHSLSIVSKCLWANFRYFVSVMLGLIYPLLSLYRYEQQSFGWRLVHRSCFHCWWYFWERATMILQ